MSSKFQVEGGFFGRDCEVDLTVREELRLRYNPYTTIIMCKIDTVGNDTYTRLGKVV